MLQFPNNGICVAGVIRQLSRQHDRVPFVPVLGHHATVPGCQSCEPICRQLAIAPSTYYRHKHQQATPTARSARAQRDDDVRVAICRVWDAHLQV